MDRLQICVCSFPKSGNTWLRHVIGHLFNCGPIEKFIPDMYTDVLFSEPIRTQKGEFFFYKSHSAKLNDIVNHTERKVNFVIHIRRNPLDVFCSQLNYVSKKVTGFAENNIDIPVPSAEELKGTEELDLLFHAFCAFGTLMNNFKDAGSWFRSNTFWYNMSLQHAHIFSIRYEDLLEDPVKTLAFFEKLFGVSSKDIALAMEKAELATKIDGKFYWKKSAGTHKDFLNENAIRLFSKIHGATCKHLGYDFNL